MPSRSHHPKRLYTALIAVSFASSGLVTSTERSFARSPREPSCHVRIEGEARGEHGRIVKQACGGACTFRLSACLNQSEPGARCEAAEVTDVRFHSTSAGKGLHRPWHLGSDPTCGATTSVRLEPYATRPKTMRLKVAADLGGPSRRVRDAVVLECRPNPGNDGCPSSAEATYCADLVDAVGARRPDVPTSPVSASECGSGEPASAYVWPERTVVDRRGEELHVISALDGFDPDPPPPPDLSSCFELPSEEAVQECMIRLWSAWANQPRDTAIDVEVRPSDRPVALFLHASTPTLWRMTLAPGARLERVLVAGHEGQRLEGLPAGVPETRIPLESVCGSPAGWEASRGGGPGHSIFIQSVREQSGLAETSFQGCYTGRRFVVPYAPRSEELPSPPTHGPGDEARDASTFLPAGCAHLEGDEIRCLTTAPGEIRMFGLDSGQSCSVGASPVAFASDVSSLAWRGEVAYFCSYEGGLFRVSLLDGSSEALQVPCDAVTSSPGGILLRADFPFAGFPAPFGALTSAEGLGAVLSDAFAPTPLAASGVSRIATGQGLLYAAWHSTDRIERADLATGVPLEPIVLQGFDDWVQGLDGTDRGELVIIGGIGGDRLLVFDENGDLLRERPLPGGNGGLDCVRSGPADATLRRRMAQSPSMQ
jgi:hypothetical protein